MVKSVKNEAKTDSSKLKHLIAGIISVIVILTFFITILFYYLTKQELKEKITTFLTTSTTAVEEKVDKNILSYLNTHLLRYSRTSTFSLFYEIPSKDLEFLNKIRISIIDSIRANSELSDLILYRTDDNAVVSAIRPGFSMDRLTSNFEDIKNILALGQLNVPRFYAAADKKTAYIFPIFNQNRWKEGAYRGFAALYLKSDSFFKTDVIDFNPNGTLVVIAGNSILNAEGDNTLSDEMIFEMINSLKDNTLINKQIHSLNYTYFYTQSPNNNLTYLYYEPTPSFFNNLANNRNYLNFYIASNLIIVIFSIIIYVSVKKLHQNITEQKSVATEYANELMKINQPTSMDLVIKKSLNINSNLPNYSVIVVEPELAYLEPLTDKQRKFTIEELKEIAKNFFKTHAMSNIVSSQLQGYVSCIINHENAMDISNLSASLGEEFKKYCKCPFNIFYSEACQSTLEASTRYTKLLSLTKYSFLYNYDQIFSLSQLEEMELTTAVVESKITEIIQEYLSEFNAENLITYLRSTLIHIRKHHYSYEQTIDFFNVVLLTIKNFFRDKSVDYQLKNTPLTEQIKCFKSLEDCISFIEKNMNQYKENLLSNRTPTNRRYMENILQYIDKHIEKVTLTDTAEEFHITTSHLSRIFKENYGINFSDHVSEKKLLRAAFILRENPKINIVELASQLGYNTPSYFSSKFKDRFGITPGAYKKEYVNSKNL